MNLIEVFVFALISALLLGIGRLLSHRLGTPGFLITAVPVGLFWAVVGFFSLRASIREMRYSLMTRPQCRNEKCTSRQYVLIEGGIDYALFRCRCGDVYVSKAGRFLQRLPDRSLSPYMKRSESGNWVHDDKMVD